MNVIVFEDEAFRKLMEGIDERIQKTFRKLTEEKNEQEWVSMNEAMALLGVKKTKLQALRNSGEILVSKHGRTIKYSRTSIMEFLDRNAKG